VQARSICLLRLQFKSSQRANFIAGLCNSETGLRALHATDHWKDRGLDVTLSVGQRNLTGLNMCQQARPWASARDRARGQFGLSKSLTTGAGHARPHDPFHHKMAGDVFQLFRHVFAQRLERATAIVAAITRREDFFLSLEMIRQRCAIMGALAGSVLISIRFRGCLLRLGGGGNFSIFLQIERQLVHGLGFAAKTGLAMCR